MEWAPIRDEIGRLGTYDGCQSHDRVFMFSRGDTSYEGHWRHEYWDRCSLWSGSGCCKGGAYAASKAGLFRLVEAVVAEHPQVKIYAIAPSVIQYRDSSGPGVHVDELVKMAIQLCSESAGL